MTATNGLAILEASIEEATANARFVEAAYRFVSDAAPIIFQSDRDVSANARQGLKEVLSLRRSPPDPAYRGLIVQIVGAFESYVASWCAVQFGRLEADLNDNGAAIDPQFRQSFLAKAGVALQHLPSGTVMGARFNFADLESSLPNILRDARPIKFHSDVVSVRLGACNAEKLEKLHEFFMLDPLFAKRLGAHKATLNWRNGSASPTAAAQLIKKELDDLIDLRNDLAHGQTRNVTVDAVSNAAKLVIALANAMAD